MSQGTNSAQCSVEVSKVDKPKIFFPGDSELKSNGTTVYIPRKGGRIFCLVEDPATKKFVTLPEESELVWLVLGSYAIKITNYNQWVEGSVLLDGMHSEGNLNAETPYYLSQDPKTQSSLNNFLSYSAKGTLYLEGCEFEYGPYFKW